jgi:glycerophosphoryl diester phosphodiesterase
MPSLRAQAGRPFVYAHRGASARAPENTQRAFALALDEGADGIELDVRLARDGVVVVAHDPDLRRRAGRPERIAELDARTLRAIDVGGDVIPALDEVLDAVVPRGALVNVEVKGDVPDRPALVRAVARLLARRSARERDAVWISSFRPDVLLALRALGVRVPLAFLYDAEHTGPRCAALLRHVVRPDGLHPHHGLVGPATVTRMHRRGLFVNAWTVDAPDRARALARAGIDGVITNDPAGLRAALRTSG